MGLFSREIGQPKDLARSADVAAFGRFWLLRDASGVDPSAVFAALKPLREPLYAEPNATPRVGEELRRHAGKGEWEAIGAWQFARDFVQDESLSRELTDGALLTLDGMRITNLAIHLPVMDAARFEELTGSPAPNDGFFGPPVFDSHFGPTRQFYFDEAVSASAARRPQRVPSTLGVVPGPVGDAVRSMWDFGQLILRGPDVVSAEIRFEPSTIRPARVAATDVDHDLFLEAVVSHLFADECDHFGPWSLIGAGRFVEDYLDPSLTGCSAHARLVGAGVERLVRDGMLGVSVCVEALSSFERERL